MQKNKKIEKKKKIFSKNSKPIPFKKKTIPFDKKTYQSSGKSYFFFETTEQPFLKKQPLSKKKKTRFGKKKLFS